MVEFSLLLAAQTYCPATCFWQGASPKPSVPTWSKKLRALETPFSTGKASASRTVLSPAQVRVPRTVLGNAVFPKAHGWWEGSLLHGGFLGTTVQGLWLLLASQVRQWA